MKGKKPQLAKDPNAMSEIIPPPAWLSKHAKAEWRRVMPSLVQRRILTVADLGSLESYCIAMGQVREMNHVLQSEGHTFVRETGIKRHPATGILADAMTRARQLASELGLTPVARQRAGGNTPSGGDDADWS